MGKILEISLPSEDIKKQITDEAKKRKSTRSKYILSLFQDSLFHAILCREVDKDPCTKKLA